MFTNAAPEERHFQVLIHQDSLFCIFNFILAFSGAYIGSLLLIHTPKTSEDPTSQEASSLMLTALFVLGQASGSTLSFLVVESL